MTASYATDVPFKQSPWRGVRLSAARADGSGATEAFVSPGLGCNLLAFVVDGTDYMVAGDAEQPPKLLGSPILYPTPNRVRDGRMTFEGRAFSFQPNMGAHFIHGLVRDQSWDVDAPVAAGERASLTARIRFAPGTAIYELFPIANTLQVTYSVTPGVVRMDWLVRNEDATQRLPFGLAIHPYFPVIGPRESVRISVPARKWMEAVELMPTGRLLDLSRGPADLRRSTSLNRLDLDDVFWGLQPDRPAVIDYDSTGIRVTLAASELFTHAVVYTPQGKGFFCIENQSCSTDAHNLYAQGMERAAHLTILDPGQTLEAWIELRVGKR
jgi:aldose 1-epimerase